eukprot:SAG31_NODE_308_length_17951_cov_4.779240_13_plen_203_part_00
MRPGTKFLYLRAEAMEFGAIALMRGASAADELWKEMPSFPGAGNTASIRFTGVDGFALVGSAVDVASGTAVVEAADAPTGKSSVAAGACGSGGGDRYGVGLLLPTSASSQSCCRSLTSSVEESARINRSRSLSARVPCASDACQSSRFRCRNEWSVAAQSARFGPAAVSVGGAVACNRTPAAVPSSTDRCSVACSVRSWSRS